MLKSFKNTKSAKRAENAKKQKAIAVAKKQTLSPPSSDTDADSDSDSDYEEILISSIGGRPQKKQVLAPQVASVKPPEPVDEPANHANHFQQPPVDEVKVSAPIPIPKKSKSKKIVIKKYYQKKVQDPPTPADPTPAAPAPARTSYIGISSIGAQQRKPATNAHATMSSRILNW